MLTKHIFYLFALTFVLTNISFAMEGDKNKEEQFEIIENDIQNLTIEEKKDDDDILYNKEATEQLCKLFQNVTIPQYEIEEKSIEIINLEAVKNCLAQGANPNAMITCTQDTFSSVSISIPVWALGSAYCDIEALKLFIAHGANPNAYINICMDQDSIQCSALLILAALLEAGNHTLVYSSFDLITLPDKIDVLLFNKADIFTPTQFAKKLPNNIPRSTIEALLDIYKVSLVQNQDNGSLIINKIFDLFIAHTIKKNNLVLKPHPASTYLLYLASLTREESGKIAQNETCFVEMLIKFANIDLMSIVEKCTLTECKKCTLLHDKKLSCERAWDAEDNKENFSSGFCPLCKEALEKRPYCNHVKCQKCSYEFC